MKKLFLGILFICAAHSYVLADEPSPLLPADSRIKLLTYDESDVYTITTKYGYQTNIVFGLTEEIQTISVGDRSLWQIIPAGNRLFIRPMEDNAQTNMTLITNKHSYQFDLKSVAGGKSTGNIYVAKFTYPDDKKKNEEKKHAAASIAEPVGMPVMASAKPPAAVPGVTQPVHPNFNYTYSGPDDSAPAQVYDDGTSTFVKYRDNQPLPSVYMVDLNGKTKSVSFSVNNNLMVIDAVAGEWMLVSNNGTVYVYNEMLNPK